MSARVGDPRAVERAVLELPVRMRFDSAREHQTAVTANVSEEGMYICSKEPPPVGSMVQFELDLSGRREPLRGSGEVVWIRVRGQGPRRPAGLGVRFRYLEGDAQEQLRRSVTARLAHGRQGLSEVEWGPRRRPEPLPAWPPEPESEEPRRDPDSGSSTATQKPGPHPPPTAPGGAMRKQRAILGLLLLILLLLWLRLA